jgi:hypothetical protein
MGTYIRTRAWPDEHLNEAEDRLSARGLVADGAFTAEGRALREAVEVATDASAPSCSTRWGTGSTSCSPFSPPGDRPYGTPAGYPSQGSHDLAPVR